MYKLDPARRDLIDEFMERPRGPYSLELTQLVNRTRLGPIAGRYVLVTVKRHQEWVLAQLPGTRGGKVIFHWDKRFTDLDEAERYVFRLRWQELTGKPLD